jgi:hypothetical protein
MYVIDNGNGTTSSFNFKAPEGVTVKKTEVLFPISEVQSVNYAAAIAIVVKQMNTKIVVGALTGNVTFTAAVDAQVTPGAVVIIALTADASNRTVSFSTGITGSNVIIEANTTKHVALVYDGSNLLLINELTQEVLSSETQAHDYAAAIAIPVAAQETIVNIAELTGAVTLTATVAATVKKGAKVYVRLQSDTTARDATLSTGFEGTTVAGVISKTKIVTFVYDGTNLVHIATNQID